MFDLLRTRTKLDIKPTRSVEWRTQAGIARRCQCGHRIEQGQRYAIVTVGREPRVFCCDCMAERRAE